MATTERVAEDVRYVEDVAKKTQTTWRESTQMKLKYPNCQENHSTCDLYNRKRGKYLK